MPANKRILAIDSQILSAIQSCGYKAFLQFMKNYRPNAVPEPLERGDLGHHILEHFYLYLAEHSVDAFDIAKEFAVEKGREHYQKMNISIEECEWTISTFYQYADFWHYDGLEVIGVEDSFTMKLYEDDELILLYQGKIDLICKMPRIEITSFDHKWRKVKAEYIPLDNQMTGYAVYLNAPVNYINEVGLQTSKEPKDKFRRVPLNFGEGVKRRWIDNTIYWGKQLDWYIQNNTWPRQHTLVPPQGISQCRWCSFNTICLSDNENEMIEKLERLYHISERWDVSRTLEEAPIGE